MRPVIVLLFALGVSACIPSLPTGGAREPNVEMPESYQTSGGDNSGASEANSTTVTWDEFFGDENLVALVQIALENNQELNITVQENLIASYEILARRGEIFPSVSGALGAGLDRVSSSSSQGVSDERNGVPEHLQSYSFGLAVSWELDIWNRVRNQADAAAHRYLAGVHGRYFLVTRLVSEIASLYYELMSLDRQLEVVSNSAQLQESALQAVRLQFQAARATSVAVTRFEAQLRDFQSRQYEIRQRIVETENRINFLCGRFPQPVVRATAGFMDLEPRAVQTGLPSQLLLNRPDIRQAELELGAARLDVDAARARFLPSINLEAGIGYGAFDITHIVDTPASIIYNIFAGLTAPLLNRTGITANYFSSDARQMQAVLRYEQSILSAHIEVLNRFNLVQNLALSYELKQQRVERLREAVNMATSLFNAGRADYLEILTAQRDALEAELELIETKQRQMSAVVILYQALGGGWRRDDADTLNPDVPLGGIP